MPIPAAHVDAAGKIYVAGTRAKEPLDLAVARALRGLKALDDAGRGFAVDTAQAMFRVRARLDAAAARLPFAPTRHALVCLFLAGARAVDARELPGDPRLVRAFADAWRATEDAPLPVKSSLPAWLVDALCSARGGDGERLCLAMTETPPSTLRTNTLKTDRAGLTEALLQDGVLAAPTARAPDGLTLRERTNLFRTRAFGEGLFEVQDEGSQLVSLLCDARAGMTVVDGCAGAGGKTLHLAALMDGKGTLWALDVHHGRLEALKQRARRAGAHNVRVSIVGGEHDPRARLREKADVVLVDAPCSGTGVMRRNPDTSWRMTRDDVTRMQDQQRGLLDSYALLVRPGGRLVYATCSLLGEENEAQVEAFLARSPAFALRDAAAILQNADVSHAGAFFRTDPTEPERCDGFFGAVLERIA